MPPPRTARQGQPEPELGEQVPQVHPAALPVGGRQLVEHPPAEVAEQAEQPQFLRGRDAGLRLGA